MYHCYVIISLDYYYSCIRKQAFTVVVAWIVTFTWFTDEELTYNHTGVALQTSIWSISQSSKGSSEYINYTY